MARSLLVLLMSVTLIGMALCQNSTTTSAPEDNDLIGSTKATTTPAGIVLPDPVDVSHSVGVSGGSAPTVKVEIDHDGIPIVHGIVMPDDPNDKKVWRNARVLNNVLIEKKQPQDQADMFVYRPQTARILDNGDNTKDSFQPSQSDSFSPSSSLPFPAFYYQRYYQDKDTQEGQQLPDNLAVETAGEPSDVNENVNDESATQSVADVVQQEDAPQQTNEGQTDGRGFNVKRKKTGLNKLTPGSNIGYGARPITYYVQPDEAKAIHDDRSPYDYEPAQHQPTSYYTNEQAQEYDNSKQDYQYYNQQPAAAAAAPTTPQRTGYYQQNSFVPGNVVPAPADAFVIRDQTYTSGGQSFNVPIPVPKDQYTQQQYAQAASQQQQPQYGQYTQYPQYQYQYQYPQQAAQQSYYQTLQQQGSKPFDFLSTKLKEEVQKAKEKFHDMTDPVVDPLMEAGQKISTNLGLPERVHKINEKVATPSILVPLAMAGGAALALGGLGTAIALSNNNATNQAFKNLPGLRNSQLAEKLSTLKIKVKRSADELNIDQYEDAEKENVLDRVISSLNLPQRLFLSQLQRTGFEQLQKTPCAKRIFCDVMIQQSDDNILIMEKRISTFLSLLDGGVAANLQALTSDVMDGIRRRNCQAFVCNNAE